MGLEESNPSQVDCHPCQGEVKNAISNILSQAADIVLGGDHLEDYSQWEGKGGYSRQGDYVEEDYKDYSYSGNPYSEMIGGNWKQGYGRN